MPLRRTGPGRLDASSVPLARTGASRLVVHSQTPEFDRDIADFTITVR
jgi:hypothetical protein